MSVGRPRLLSNADLDRAKALVRSGSRKRDIACEMLVSVPTLNRRLAQTYKQPERRW
jgi:Helix-turn-helix domain of resolvase